MHTGFTVDFDHAWLAGRDFPREALLRAIVRTVTAPPPR